MIEATTPTTRKNLKRHICELTADKLYDCVASLSDEPLVVCSRCGAAANSVRNVCATRWGLTPGGKRPVRHKPTTVPERSKDALRQQGSQ